MRPRLVRSAERICLWLIVRLTLEKKTTTFDQEFQGRGPGESYNRLMHTFTNVVNAYAFFTNAYENRRRMTVFATFAEI